MIIIKSNQVIVLPVSLTLVDTHACLILSCLSPTRIEIPIAAQYTKTCKQVQTDMREKCLLGVSLQWTLTAPTERKRPGAILGPDRLLYRGVLFTFIINYANLTMNSSRLGKKTARRA